MSFSTVIATTSFVSVLTDGRHLSSGAKEIVNEEFCKVMDLTENRFITFGGSVKRIFSIIEMLQESIKEKSLYDSVIEIRNYLSTIENEDKVMLCFGEFKNNIPQLYTLNSNELEIQTHIPDPGELTSICVSGHKELFDRDFNDIIVEELSRLGAINPDTVLEAQSKLIDYIASKDKSVNTNKFKLLLPV
ncbi:hypothetical protein POL82_03145 [Priestia aryabhattai]|uniref:hypothetical protein n=1 Tax=Priestia aryabhattai TaxID=412384 RepID=UPI00234E4F8B|nr:hypothetical protein [Priestia aryabhattai]MDC7762462.1 hypothetical protein [Priestia aryabhattai]